MLALKSIFPNISGLSLHCLAMGSQSVAIIQCGGLGVLKQIGVNFGTKTHGSNNEISIEIQASFAYQKRLVLIG